MPGGRWPETGVPSGGGGGTTGRPPDVATMGHRHPLALGREPTKTGLFPGEDAARGQPAPAPCPPGPVAGTIGRYRLIRDSTCFLNIGE